jgi:hypothetical protein
MAGDPRVRNPGLPRQLMPKPISQSHAGDEAQSARRALRRTLVRRLARNSVIVAGFVLVALGIGATGYHTLDGLPWLDAVLNAAMILTGMGPIAPISTPAAKVFATVYALFSGVFFLTMVAVLLAPALHHFLHRFHLDMRERDSHRTARHE